VSWSLSLGTGTSGGTLAPLFTIGGGLGSAIGALTVWALPAAGVDVRVAALVGMAALFAGASRALLASVVFAFETTRQPMSLLPLLGGCTTAYLVSALAMRHSIMTEKIARRGARVVVDYTTDPFEQVLVSDVARSPVVTLRADRACDEVAAWIRRHEDGSFHQGFPVVDEAGRLMGMVMRRELLDVGALGRRVLDLVRTSPAVVFEGSSLREAADHMVTEKVGRLPVVARSDPRRVVGMVTRSDILAVLARRLQAERRGEPRYRLPGRRPAAVCSTP
jgi:CIC family chloride channel protein